MIDIYCERIGPGLWAEPFNALTNLAFFAAALGSWRLIQHSPHRSYGMGVLVALVASIGIGSALFHTFATKWAQFLDVLPILLFQVCFIGLYSRRIISLNQWIVGVFLCAFLAATLWGRQFPGVLNGSLPYAPGFLVLIGLGVYHAVSRKRERFAMAAASGVFLIGVFFRSIDAVVCECFPVGTHFLWHLSNGVVIYLSMRGLVLNWAEQ